MLGRVCSAVMLTGPLHVALLLQLHLCSASSTRPKDLAGVCQGLYGGVGSSFATPTQQLASALSLAYFCLAGRSNLQLEALLLYGGEELNVVLVLFDSEEGKVGTPTCWYLLFLVHLYRSCPLLSCLHRLDCVDPSCGSVYAYHGKEDGIKSGRMIGVTARPGSHLGHVFCTSDTRTQRIARAADPLSQCARQKSARPAFGSVTSFMHHFNKLCVNDLVQPKLHLPQLQIVQKRWGCTSRFVFLMPTVPIQHSQGVASSRRRRS